MVSNALSQYGCDLKGKKNCFINLIHRSEKWGLYPLAVTHLRSQSYFIRVRIISQVNSHLWVNVPFTKTQPLILIENRVILVYSFSDFSKEEQLQKQLLLLMFMVILFLKFLYFWVLLPLSQLSPLFFPIYKREGAI